MRANAYLVLKIFCFLASVPQSTCVRLRLGTYQPNSNPVYRHRLHPVGFQRRRLYRCKDDICVRQMDCMPDFSRAGFRAQLRPVRSRSANRFRHLTGKHLKHRPHTRVTRCHKVGFGVSPWCRQTNSSYLPRQLRKRNNKRRKKVVRKTWIQRFWYSVAIKYIIGRPPSSLVLPAHSSFPFRRIFFLWSLFAYWRM